MTILKIKKSEIVIIEKDVYTSGSSEVFKVQFMFSADWDGLVKTVTFSTGDVERSVILTDDICDIPHEVLKTPATQLKIGVYGTDGDTLVLPTVWKDLGRISKGAAPGELTKEPTPDVYRQIIALEQQAVEIANSVRQDADNGLFDGKPGKDGIDGKDGLNGKDGENGADGQPGKDGENGIDGFSPTAKITQISKGAEIEITDRNGTTTAIVYNGEPGKDGEDGKNGLDGLPGTPGADGKDGITPTIGSNGNWFIGETDTGKPSRGATGEQGIQGVPGEKGETGAQGTQGIQGAKGDKGDPGTNGKDGVDGISATHSWNGTTLTITSASGTSSANLKGEQGEKGETGNTGLAGYTPQKGVDYWTAADKTEIINDVLALLPDGDEVSY